MRVDGTSIDQLEELARERGLDAEQKLLPSDHLLRAEHPALPALVVVLTPSCMLHFVVIWNRVGGRVKSRLFAARAILAGADLTVLDESIAALDPDTALVELHCVRRRARSLLLTAHP